MCPINKELPWSLVAVVNSEDVLQHNLLVSAEAQLASEVVLERDCLSASMGYNAGLKRCSSDVVVFAHQDVYLPPGWGLKLSRSIQRLEVLDPEWGVGGVYGIKASGIGAGYVFSTGLGRFVGSSFVDPMEVRSLDELLLIVRRSAGLPFDERLPGFHLYGTDICLQANAKGMKNYVLPCFVLHNSNRVKRLPIDFWKAYLYLRKKWRSVLPVATPCTEITVGCLPIIEYLLHTAYLSLLRENYLGSSGLRVSDPARFYWEHIVPVLEKLGAT